MRFSTPAARALGVPILLLLAGGCGTDQTHQLPPAAEDLPLQTFSGVTLRESQAGVLRWVLEAGMGAHHTS